MPVKNKKNIKNNILFTENSVLNSFFNYKSNGVKIFDVAQKLNGQIIYSRENYIGLNISSGGQ